MTLLDTILTASSKAIISDKPLEYPFPLSANIDPVNPNPNSIISPIDSSLIQFNSTFFDSLHRELNSSPDSLDSPKFVEFITPFLTQIAEIKFGGGLDLKKGKDFDDYCCKLIVKIGGFIGRDVLGLIIQGCFLVENWKILQTLIEHKLVGFEFRGDFLGNLVAKNRSKLICLCVKNFKDMGGSDIVRVLRYFLSPSKDGIVTMSEVRKEWKREADLAIKKVSEKKASGKDFVLEKDAALLLMNAYDGFSSWELCLHYLVSSCVDGVVFSSAVSELNVEEMLGLIRYLGKWLRKYERFPQAGPCSEAVPKLGLKLVQWVPELEDVVTCLGLVVDEHFTSLAMRSEFRDEVKAIEDVVRTLASEGRLYGSLVNVIDTLKPETVTD